ncbi:pyruvate dehydrogenase complex dihydrolipoamide acetyltransferase component (E2) [Rhizophlyctis rosea]|nr:pyruvate dehydrogenase complex dihydrolipoamide acetyltransferase component (E2) [Rhizophlyctis rosea]
MSAVQVNALRSVPARLLRTRCTVGSALRARAGAAVVVASSRQSLHTISSRSPRATPNTLANRSLISHSRRYASDYPSHKILDMPALSPTMTQGNLVAWKKAVGDEIQPGDVLAVVETDKATMDFECQDEGFLAKIFIQEGTENVPVGKPVGILVEEKGDVEKFADFKPEEGGAAPAPAEAKSEEPAPKKEAAPKEAAPAKAAPAPAAKSSEGDRVFASPAARALAIEKGIDIEGVTGTGPNGRILKSDVESYKPSAKKPAAGAPAAAAAGASYTDIQLTNVRKVIGSRLLESKVTIPHFYQTVEINVEKTLKLREVLNAQANGKYKLSVNDFVVKAASLALKDVPQVNSSWQDTFIRQYNTADIAVAVATEGGLITPIIPQAEGKGLSAISNKVKELAEKARAGKLQPHEYQGGSFTISNLGMYGIQHFTAIINPPHASILAVGGTQDKLVLDESSEKGFSVAKVMNVTLSNDHRVVDGAVGAQWLQRFKGYLENPLTMLL